VVRRLVVFRFDRNPLVCRDRIALLRRMNPGVPVFGLYGGPAGGRRHAFELGHRYFLHLDGFYAIEHAPIWSWKNGDLALMEWFRDVGSRLDFDVVHLVEWDLLLLEPLGRVYSSVPPGAVGLTARTPLTDVSTDWRWVRGTENVRQLAQLRSWAADTWGYSGQLDACLGVGPCFPRAFLVDYLAADPPELCHDELRWPLLGRVLGYEVADTQLRRAWHDEAEDGIFGSTGAAVSTSTILSELAKVDGRRAFHPVHTKNPARVSPPGRSRRP
jgi:hypothetical protein